MILTPSTEPLLDPSRAADRIARFRRQIEAVIVGKPEVVEMTIVAVLARGHLLIADVPGVGKTTLAHTIARSIDGVFQRIQFTNDLLPSDVVGTTVFDARSGEFVFKPGPIFANVVLADEINRTTPKTQSCLLEAMNEGQLSVDNRTHQLPSPFLVLATQNPIEFAGTFPLPESQLDRFLLRLKIGYPSAEDERRILTGRNPAQTAAALTPVLTPQEVVELQCAADAVKVADTLADYVVALAHRTRTDERFSLGISPRGCLALVHAAKALALIRGRSFVTPDDVKALMLGVFAHRVALSSRISPKASDSALSEALLNEVLAGVPVPL